MKDVADKKNTRGKKAVSKVVSKYERSIKAGFVKNEEGAEFPVSEIQTQNNAYTFRITLLLKKCEQRYLLKKKK